MAVVDFVPFCSLQVYCSIYTSCVLRLCLHVNGCFLFNILYILPIKKMWEEESLLNATLVTLNLGYCNS